MFTMLHFPSSNPIFETFLLFLFGFIEAYFIPVFIFRRVADLYDVPLMKNILSLT